MAFNRTIDWRVVGRLAAGSVPMTVVTIVVLNNIGIQSSAAHDLITVVLTSRCSSPLRRWFFATKLSRVTPCSLPRCLPNWSLSSPSSWAPFSACWFRSRRSAPAPSASLRSSLLYPKLPTARIVGSDIAHAVPLTLAAGIGHWYLGSINVDVLMSLLIGSIPGILIGSFAAPAHSGTRLALCPRRDVAAGGDEIIVRRDPVSAGCDDYGGHERSLKSR